MDKVAIIALIDALIEDALIEKKERFLGKQGKRGPRGFDGSSFDFESNKDSIKKIINNHIDLIRNELTIKFNDLSDEDKNSLKLKFEDLSEEEVESLKGTKGPRGQRGKQGIPGRDLQIEDIKDDVFSFVKDIYNSEKSSFKLCFSDLSDEDKDSLKLKFEDLSENDVELLKGIKGPRGQRGKQGLAGIDGINGKDGINGVDGLNGMRGVPGVAGIAGKNGKDGRNGKDAPEIVDVEVDLVQDKMSFTIFFDDGTKIETNSVKLPSITKTISSCVAAYINGGGESGTTLKILKDGVLLGESEELDFTGENINVSYNSVTKRSTVSVDEKCISISDEGDQIVSCLSSMNFEGDNVEVISGTKIADWPSLDVVDPIGSWESPTAGNVTVKILSTEVAKRLEATRICDEEVYFGKAATATSGTNVALGDCSIEEKARVLGIFLENKQAGEVARILLFGNVEDASFNFPLNSELYLGHNGDISNNIPGDALYTTTVGSSNGTGSIFINIDNPIEN